VNARPVVYVDMDGVVADLVSAWLRAYNEVYQDTLTIEQITRWEIDEFTKPACGRKIFDLLTPRLYLGVQPIPDALAGVTALRDAGLRVVFATATGGGMADAKRSWLERHGFLAPKTGGSRAPQRDLVFIADKRLLGGGILLDDYPANLDGWDRDGLLFAAPWNSVNARPRYDWAGAVPAILERVNEAPSVTGHHLVRGPRAATYGHPAENDARIAGMWHALFGWHVRVTDVWQAMVCVKLSREHNVPTHENRADIVGYADTGALIHQRLAERKKA